MTYQDRFTRGPLFAAHVEIAFGPNTPIVIAYDPRDRRTNYTGIQNGTLSFNLPNNRTANLQAVGHPMYTVNDRTSANQSLDVIRWDYDQTLRTPVPVVIQTLNASAPDYSLPIFGDATLRVRWSSQP